MVEDEKCEDQRIYQSVFCVFLDVAIVKFLPR